MSTRTIYDLLEPAMTNSGVAHQTVVNDAIISTAISLKRIADALDQLCEFANQIEMNTRKG